MRNITIFKRYFLKSDCYKSATKQTSIGVQVHSTGANNPYLHRYVQPDDGRLGPNKYNNDSNRPGRTVCASAYIGKLQDDTVAIYQVLPWDYRCWLSGSGSNGNANRMAYVGYEICEDDKKHEAYFRAAVMGAAVNLTAYLCTLFGVTPDHVVKTFSQGKALSVMDHKELHGLLLASNHGDITHWLKLYGLTMTDFRKAVQEAMDEGVNATYIDCDSDPADGSVTPPTGDTGDTGEKEDETPLYKAQVVCPGSYLNIRRSKSTGSTSLGTVNRGQLVDVLNDSDADWWRITYNGTVGYAMTHSGTRLYLQAESTDEEDGKSYTVTITGLDADSATQLLETYGSRATAEAENG